MELQGLDLHKHNEPAYPGSAWEEGEKGPYSSSAITESLMGGRVLGGSRKAPSTTGNFFLKIDIEFVKSILYIFLYILRWIPVDGSVI